MPTAIVRLRTLHGELDGCRLCPKMIGPVVHGPPVLSKVILVGQAPGPREGNFGRPFAWTAGRTLFRWFEQAGIDEITARRKIYIAAVTRCYPGPSKSGRGDRVPSMEEQDACAGWLESELAIIRPKVIIPVGKLAIARFFREQPLERLIGKAHVVDKRLVIPLPHPSGASSWIHQGNHPQLLKDALRLIETHVQPLL